MKQTKKLLKQLLDMQQTQVVVVREVQVGLRSSTAVFPGCMPMPMRAALSVPAVPVTTALCTTTVMPTATGPK